MARRRIIQRRASLAHQAVSDHGALARPSPSSPRTEYIQICRMVGMGFVVMGFIGYFVKLIHIPINNIVSSQATRTMADSAAWLPGARPRRTMLTLSQRRSRSFSQLVGGA